MKKSKRKSFVKSINEFIIELFKILHQRRNIGKKKFRTEMLTSYFFVSFWNQLSIISNRFISMFLFLIKNMFTRVLAASFSPHSLWRSEVKWVLHPGFSNTLCETLRTYSILGMFFTVGEIKSVMRKVWKITQCNTWFTSRR